MATQRPTLWSDARRLGAAIASRFEPVLADDASPIPSGAGAAKLSRNVGARRRIAVIFFLLLAVVAVREQSAGAVNRAFPNGWTNPVSPNTFEDWGFASCSPPYIPGRAHLGADSQGSSANQQVVAMGTGTVVKVVAPPWGPGGAIGIEHTAGDGTRFLAVYGHLNNGVGVGAGVSAGTPIGTLWDQADNSHLHLGIRPLSPGEDAGSLTLWGNVECPGAPTHGFVDPIPFLAAHPSGTGPTPTTTPTTRPTTTTIVHNPEGRLESAIRTDGGHIRVLGWARDADVSGPIQVQALVDDNNVGQVTANMGRSDVGPHGFDFVVPADWRSQSVCVKALNAGGGVDVVLPGCTPVPFALCPDTPPTMTSRTPNDKILATAGDDVIWASGGGAKIAAGQGGNDIICGGGATGGPGGNQIVGGPGNNLIFTGPGDNDVSAGPGQTTVISGGGHNRIAVCPNTIVLNRSATDEIQPSKNCGPRNVSATVAEAPTTSTTTTLVPATTSTTIPMSGNPTVTGDGPTTTTSAPSAGGAGPASSTSPPHSTNATGGPPSCATATSPTGSPYEVAGTGTDGLTVRRGPSPYHRTSYTLKDGDAVAVVCYVDSVPVNGNGRWNRLTDGNWIADAFTTTPRP